MNPLRSLRADNPGPFTHEGTRTYLLGHRRVAVIDPGPDLPDHLAAVAREVAGADRVTVLLTHGHGDHAGGLDALLRLLPEADAAGAGHPGARPLPDGARVETDAGALEAVHTPGHTADHLAFRWREGRALFAGDMVLGVGDTTWVAGYPGCVADYLSSLDRLEALPLEKIHPAHGPDQHDPSAVWARYRAHREARIGQVRQAMTDTPGATVDEILERVYGDTIATGLRKAARESLRALMEYVEVHPGGRP